MRLERSAAEGSLRVMCGIAGYSLSPKTQIDRTVVAQALLAGIAERGGDAAGFAHRGHSGAVTTPKPRPGASELVELIDVPRSATELLVRGREFPKGHPSLGANNHPTRHGAVVGIHNGTIV